MCLITSNGNNKYECTYKQGSLQHMDIQFLSDIQRMNLLGLLGGGGGE